MKIEGVSIQPARPLALCCYKTGSKPNHLVTRSLFDQRLQSAFVGITGKDWELNRFKDLACLYELNPKDLSVFVEAPLTTQLIDRLSASLLLEDVQILQLRELLQKLETDNAARNPRCNLTHYEDSG